MPEPSYTVMTTETGEPSGMDSTILRMPALFYVDVDGERTLVITSFQRFLLALARKSASDLGERLHSGEFVVTADPATVQAWSTRDHCPRCREATEAALREMAHNPAQEWIVGHLYWA